MYNEIIKQRSNELALHIDGMVVNESHKVEDIHLLRKKSREVLSLLCKNELHYSNIKKIIKLSNKIRDIDVFINEYLESLPKNLKQEINLDLLIFSINNQRQQDCIYLLKYLKHFSMPNMLTPYKEDKTDAKKCELVYDKKQLHRFRIYIKSLIYRYKNHSPNEIKTIKLLTQIKDLLGLINDNNNALKILNSYCKNIQYFKKIKKHTKTQNKDYYQKAKVIVDRLSL